MADVIRLYSEATPFVSFDPGSEAAPANRQAELIVIGSLLKRNRTLDSVIEFLQPSHFSDSLSGKIYGEIVRRIVDNEPVGVVTLNEWVAIAGFSGDRRKATRHLSTLLTSGIPGDIRGIGLCIVNCAVRRDLLSVSKKIATIASDARVDVKMKIPELAAQLDGAVLGADRQRVSTFSEAMAAAVKEAKEAAERGGPGGLPIPGFPRIASAVVLKPQELTILGGCSGSGKSGIGFQIAINIARQIRDDRSEGEVGRVLAFSLEMSRAALATRALSAASGVPATTIQRGLTSPIQMELIESAAREFDNLPMDIWDINGLSKDDIRALLYRSKLRNKKISLVIIDHLNLVNITNERHGMAAGTTEVANSALEFAKRFECHVLGLCQLNRKDMAARKDRRPTLADLRYTGSFEANADQVLLLHRQIQWESDVPPEREENEYVNDYEKRRNEWAWRREDLETKAELLISKVRSGRAGFPIRLIFDSGTTSFSEDPSVPL